MAAHGALYQPDGVQYMGIEPSSRAASSFRAALRLPDGLEVEVDRPLMHTWVSRVAGQRTRPVVVTPVASIEPLETVAIVSGEHVDVSVDIVALRGELSGTLQISAPEGWTVERTPEAIKGLGLGEREQLWIRLLREPGALAGALQLSFNAPEGTSDRTMHVIDYPHIMPADLVTRRRRSSSFRSTWSST